MPAVCAVAGAVISGYFQGQNRREEFRKRFGYWPSSHELMAKRVHGSSARPIIIGGEYPDVAATLHAYGSPVPREPEVVEAEFREVNTELDAHIGRYGERWGRKFYNATMARRELDAYFATRAVKPVALLSHDAKSAEKSLHELLNTV